MSSGCNVWRCGVNAILIAILALSGLQARAESPRITMAMQETALSEVMSMLARQQRVNILMSDDIDATVSFNLYEVTVPEAIKVIASAAGYAVERRDDNYFIVEPENAGKYATSNLTELETYRIQYADPDELESILTPYLSEYGILRVMSDRMLIAVEDTPEFLRRFRKLIREIDLPPKQVLIEAKILEISLSAEDSFGIDWSDFFSTGDTTGEYGTQGLAGAGTSGSTGFFLTLSDPDVNLVLNALEQNGRVRTLSTPKLLAMNNQEASVIIGDRRGFTVTTTINQVTSESIEFLESGVILRVTPRVDDQGRVLLDVHPEVSTGTVDGNGIPSQVTTEVTTQLLVPSGQTVFIGGLMKHTSNLNRSGIPVLGRVPGLRRLFSSNEQTEVNTETIVLITPHIVEGFNAEWNALAAKRVDEENQTVDGIVKDLVEDVERFDPATTAVDK